MVKTGENILNIINNSTADCGILLKFGALSTPEKVKFLPRCMECRRGLAMRILSVRLSVRPSVKRVHCDKTEERSVQIFILYER